MRKIPKDLTDQEEARQAKERAESLWRSPVWASLTIQSGRAVNDHPLQVALVAPNIVRFSGMVSTGALALGITLFTLPVGLRPQRNKVVVVALDGLSSLLGGLASGSATLDVRTDGTVRLRNAVPAAAIVFYGVTLDL